MNAHRFMRASGAFKCERGVCDKGFQRLTLLEDHLRVHDNILFKCFFCPYTSGNDDNFNVHLNSLIGFRPFPCDFCEIRFYKSSAKRSHEETVHEIINDKYKCLKCEFTTYAAKNLNYHIRKYQH